MPYFEFLMMQLTEAQQAELDRQRRESPGRKRFMVEFTPEQREQYRRMVAEEMRSKPANLARAATTRNALREATFSGWLRRAIASSGYTQERIAAELNVDVSVLNRFLLGEASLDSSLIDHLIDFLGLAPQLQEID
jgi:ribosome-binding protein aMBF1 (putative translation factor)